ncbi:MAG TPA: hypothetical protein VNO21_00080 [Polyangiaceae bacterium]|nr:hypothetical protein [Polyangiaceae bacterium]
MRTPAKASAGAVAKKRLYKLSPEAEEEARQAIADIERGDYIELDPEQLRKWCETGDFPWPWPDESPG